MMTDEILIEPDSEDIAADIEESMPTVMLPLAELLPPDFKLPALVRFCPNQELRQAVVDAASYALSINVSGSTGVVQADSAIAAVRESLTRIEEHFEEPKQIAHSLHKHITTMLAEWLAPGTAAVRTVGARLFAERTRLDAKARQARDAAQAEADRQAREAATRQAEIAKAAHAPASVVADLLQQAETATAPPVVVPELVPSSLVHSTTVTTWKARLKGTSPIVVANPKVADLTPDQRVQVFALLRAILDGKAPLGVIEVNWSYVNKRAAADRGAFDIPGLEAYEDGSMRSKGRR